MRLYMFLLAVTASLAISMLSGCIPLVTGVKEYKSGDTTISFISGFDVSAAANGIDTVDNNRGIRPSTDGYSVSKAQGVSR